jgi:putative transcriptional regulator
MTWQATTPISNDIMLTTSRDVLASIGEGEGPPRYRVALGYSGWSEGQLESELAGNAWLTCPANAELLFGSDWENLYSAVLRQLGIDLNQLSDSIGHA